MEMFRLLIGPDEGANAAQLSFRAVIIFILGVIYVRVAGRRTFSQGSPLDIVVALIVGSNLSRVATGKADFWPALTATLVLALLHRLLAWLALRWNVLSRLVKAAPAVLVRDGVADPAAMRRHGIGETDLMEGLRSEQEESLEGVHLATLENSGKISVVPRKKSASGGDASARPS